MYYKNSIHKFPSSSTVKGEWVWLNQCLQGEHWVLWILFMGRELGPLNHVYRVTTGSSESYLWGAHWVLWIMFTGRALGPLNYIYRESTGSSESCLQGGHWVLWIMFTGRALGPLNHPYLILLQGWGKNCIEETWLRLGRIRLGGVGVTQLKPLLLWHFCACAIRASISQYCEVCFTIRKSAKARRCVLRLFHLLWPTAQLLTCLWLLSDRFCHSSVVLFVVGRLIMYHS